MPTASDFFLANFYPPSPFLSLLLPETLSWVLWMQKLKTRLLRAQGSKVLPLKPGAGQYITMHATSTARDFFLAKFYPAGPFTCIFFFQTQSWVFLVLAVASTGSCVGLQNKIDHPVHR